MNYTITNKRTGNTYDVIAGLLEIPNKGVWIISNLSIDTDEGFLDNDEVSVSFMDKSLVGIFTDIEIYAGFISGTVIGGKGTLPTELESISFQGVSVRNIVEYIAQKTAHQISPLSDSSLLNVSIQRFEKLKDKASSSLNKIMEIVGGSWRISLDGQIIIFYESYPEISVKYPSLEEFTNYDVLDKKPNLGYWQIYCEEFLVEPGFTISGNKVKETIYDLNIDRHMNVSIKWTFFEPDHVQLYDLTQQTRELLFLNKYRMKVISQSSNGLLTVIPDPDLDILKNGLRDVPISYTAPNMRAKILPGAICFVEFANGDPGKPVVTSFEDTNSLIEIDIANPSSTQNAARQGDRVSCGSFTIASTPPPMPMTPGTLTITYTDAFGTTVPFFSISAPDLNTTATTPTVNIIGNIVEGSSKLKIGN